MSHKPYHDQTQFHYSEHGRDVMYLPDLPPDNISRFRKLVAIVDVEPHKQAKVSLGTFIKEHPPVGFVSQCEPDDELRAAVDCQILTVPAGQSSLYELHLFVVNYRDTPVEVTVWQLLRDP